jgi:hypothetical protein
VEELVSNEIARGNWTRSYRHRWMFLCLKIPFQPPLSKDKIVEKAGPTLRTTSNAHML